MKTLKLLFLSFILIISNRTHAQTSATLDINNIAANVYSNGSLFWDLSQNTLRGFEVPNGSGIHSIFNSNLWIGGLDSEQNLHFAGSRYNQVGNDFFYGPIATDYTSSPYPTTYDMVWKVDRATIEYHIANFGTQGYIVPSAIATWPGNGNTANGESQYLAPFYDVNLNGIYEPANGDYPIIRGDQAVFYIINDLKENHTESGGASLGFEIHGMLYSFDNPSDSALYNTIFANFNIYNHSNNDYDSVYVGLFVDMDLGYSMDDYVGCDTINNMWYVYNSTNDDIDIYWNRPAYGIAPPAQGSLLLNEPMAKFMFFNNSSGTTGDPFIASEYYNFLKGKWKDGTPITYGGTGYGGITPTNFMFSGTPETGAGWNELSEENSPGDRRGVLSSGPFNFVKGRNMCIDIAFPFARDYNGTNLTSIALLRQRVQEIQSFYNDKGFTCDYYTSINDNRLENNKVYVYPNPNNGVFSIRSSTIITQLNIFNLAGEIIYAQTINSLKADILLESQPKGIYFYQIKDLKGFLNTGKIIIN